MSTTDTPTLDEALGVARRLSRQDRARLIARLADELATPHSASTAPPTPADAWSRLLAFNADIRAHYPNASPAARLEADRRERDEATRTDAESDDVHP